MWSMSLRWGRIIFFNFAWGFKLIGLFQLQVFSCILFILHQQFFLPQCQGLGYAIRRQLLRIVFLFSSPPEDYRRLLFISNLLHYLSIGGRSFFIIYWAFGRQLFLPFLPYILGRAQQVSLQIGLTKGRTLGYQSMTTKEGESVNIQNEQNNKKTFIARIASYQISHLIYIRYSMKFIQMKDNNSVKRSRKDGVVNIREVGNYRPQRFALPHGYSSTPSQEYIFANNGKCPHLTISCQYGRVEWTDPIDICTIRHSLKEIVRFAYRELQVYQQNCGTPKVGLELNRPCLATFFTGIHQGSGYLLEACKNNGSELVKIEGNCFTVSIPHFTKYSFNDEDQQKKSKNIKQPSPSNFTLTSSPSSSPFNNSPPTYSPLIRQSFQNYSVRSDLSNSSRDPRVLNRNLFASDIQRQPILQIIPQQLSSRMQVQAQTRESFNSKILQTLLAFVESDKVYYNKDVTTKSLQPQEILALENKYRKRSDLPLLKEPQGKIQQSLIAQGCVVTAKRYQCDFQPYFEVLTVNTIKETSNPITQTEHSFFGLITQGIEFTPQTMGSICTNQAYPFSVRRILSLYSILFHDKINISIGSHSQSMKYLPNPKVNTGSSKMQLFKNWISWVTNATYSKQLEKEGLFLYNNKVTWALALRKPREAINFLFVNNRWDDADFITNIEDNAYRAFYSQVRTTSLCPQLESIFSEKVEMLQKCIYDWFLIMAFSVWYFKGKTVIDHLQAAMKHIPRSNIKTLHEEYRLIQLFLLKNGKQVESLLCPSNEKLNPQKLSCMYLFSNHLGLAELEESIISSEEKSLKKYRYGHYRYQILRKITMAYSHHRVVVDLVKKDKYLGKEEKDCFLKELAESTGIIEQSFKLQLQANRLINQGNLIEGLKKLFLISKWNDSTFEKICKLVTLPKFLIGFKKSVNLSLRGILQQRRELFSDILILLAVNLKESLGDNQLLRLISILQGKSRFSIYITPTVHAYLLNTLQNYIIEVIVLRNSFFQLIVANNDLRQSIHQLFKDRVVVFKKMEEVVAKM